jgi:3-carboxy-cis,cis-muconate cycloisomerase
VYMPKAEAQTLVTEACGETSRSGQNLIAVLESRTDAPVDWRALERPENYLGSSAAFIAAALKV